jgi:small subunit ribosomal protein S18
VSEAQASDQTQQQPPSDGGSGARPERPRRRGGGFRGRRRVCAFCADKTATIDYKEPSKLRRYVSDRGKIEPRRKTGTCAKHQRALTQALKRARHLALLPFTSEHIRVSGVFPSRG